MRRCAAAAGRPAGASRCFGWLRFARQRAGMALLGFRLSRRQHGGQAWCPPYLTRPIFDTCWSRTRTRKRGNFRLIPWYLAGMAGASVLTWLLSWARTYVLAWVSERVAADLRNQTYAHLQRLSLEFFGGKRTGDLISRREHRHRPDQLSSSRSTCSISPTTC